MFVVKKIIGKEIKIIKIKIEEEISKKIDNT